MDNESPTVTALKELLIEIATANGDVMPDGSFRGPFKERLERWCGTKR